MTKSAVVMSFIAHVVMSRYGLCGLNSAYKSTALVAELVKVNIRSVSALRGSGWAGNGGGGAEGAGG